MPIRATENLFAARIFLAGVILALVVGAFSMLFGSNVHPIIFTILVLMGVLVGVFVAEKDVRTFLLASVSVVVVSYAGMSGFLLDSAIRGVPIWALVSSVIGSLLALFVPATIVVAIKTVFSLAKS